MHTRTLAHTDSLAHAVCSWMNPTLFSATVRNKKKSVKNVDWKKEKKEKKKRGKQKRGAIGSQIIPLFIVLFSPCPFFFFCFSIFHTFQ